MENRTEYFNVLIPLDGSESIGTVFSCGRSLLERLNGTNITILHVISPGEKNIRPMREAYITQAVRSVEEFYENCRREIGFPQPERRADVNGEIVEGRPHKEILKFAVKNETDLIILSGHYSPSHRKTRFGAVVKRVMSASNTPLFLLHPDIPSEEKYPECHELDILVMLDESVQDECALDCVGTLAENLIESKRNIMLLNVINHLSIPVYYGPELNGVPLNWGVFLEKEMERRKTSSLEYLTRMEQGLQAKGFNVRSEVLEGSTITELCEYISGNMPDMVVITIQCKSGIRKMLFGSSTDAMINSLTCPILLVKSSK